MRLPSSGAACPMRLSHSTFAAALPPAKGVLPLGLFALAVLGCESTPSGVAPGADAGTSPNAAILPAPLATEPPEVPHPASVADAGLGGVPVDASGRPVLPAAPAPTPLRSDVALPPEAAASRDTVGVTLEGAFRFRELPGSPKVPEVAPEGVREAAHRTALTLRVDLAEVGRVRVELLSRALPLPTHSEVRARADRYGSLVLWPDGSGYRVIPPGGLRTVFGERRVDVTPLTLVTPTLQPGEGRRAGLPTRKLEATTSLGTLRLEVARLPEAGEGGPLFCRLLGELASIDPRSPLCQAGDVPLFAAYTWAEGGGITLELTAAAKRTDIAANTMLVPPPGVPYQGLGLPSTPHGIFLTRDELVAFRTGPAVAAPNVDRGAPGEGFVAENRTDTLQYLLLDGVPVVLVPPGAERYVIGPPRGRYTAQWRTFLGERIGAPFALDIPARLTLGGARDAGAPDGG